MKYNVDAVLDRLGLEVDSSSGDERYLHCPFHDDSDPSFSINSETGLWICFVGCGSGNLVKLVSDYLGLNKAEAKKWLSGNVEEVKKSLLKQKLSKVIKKKKEEPPCASRKSSYWTEPMLSVYYDFLMPDYLDGRGFTGGTISKWKVGYDRKADEIIIPVFSVEDILLGCIRRSLKMHRYTNTLGLDKSKVLFGQHFVKDEKTIAVVEGALDVMWLDQFAIPAVGLLGCNLSNTQLSLLIEYHRIVVLAFDNDKAGRKGEEVAREKLRGKMVVKSVQMPEGRKDVQEVGAEGLEILFGRGIG